MSSYLYVVFPRGKQPDTADVRDLQSFAAALAGRFAWGVSRQDGRLTLALERATYDHVVAIDPGLEQLIARWQSRGCELLDHLAFVKDAAALKPGHNATLNLRDVARGAVVVRQNDSLAAKHYAVQDSVARSLLAVERTLAHYSLIHKAATVFPYILMAAAAAGTLAVGIYARDRLSSAGREPRQELIERMATDAEAPSALEHMK